MHSIRILAISLFLLPASALEAQQSRQIPQIRNFREARASDLFVYNQSRQQILIGGDFCKSTATIREFGFQRETVLSWTYSGRKVPVRVWMSHWRSTARPFSSVFALNRNSPRLIVYNAVFDLPSLRSIDTGFRVNFKLISPFQFVRSRGDLLLEIEVGGNPLGPVSYYLDGDNFSERARSREFVKAGKFKSGESSWLRVYDGGSVGEYAEVFLAEHMKQPYPTVMAIGTDDTKFGNLKLPFDLTPLGAAGNTLGTSVDYVFPVTLTKVDAWGGRFRLRIPFDRAFARKSIFMQAMHVDASSNALGLVLSNAIEIGLPAYYPHRTLTATASSATGRLVQAVPITQLIGTFN